MARPRYSANKRQRELKKKAERERKLARKHARKAGSEIPANENAASDATQMPREILPSDDAAPAAEDPD
jgi:hypothetical protein